MNFKPLHDRVAIEPLPIEEKTAGGIIIPDNAKEKPVQGKIIAVGNGTRNSEGEYIPMDVKEGDIVLYGKWAGTEVKVGAKEVIVMKESDIMGILA